jgi:hypothetical protein
MTALKNGISTVIKNQPAARGHQVCVMRRIDRGVAAKFALSSVVIMLHLYSRPMQGAIMASPAEQ